MEVAAASHKIPTFITDSLASVPNVGIRLAIRLKMVAKREFHDPRVECAGCLAEV